METSRHVGFPLQITALWTVFLLGLLFHTQLALIPLFHGIDVAESHTHEYLSLDAIMWFMVLFFGLPLLAILGSVLCPSRRFRQLHFRLTLVYTVLNAIHLVMDIWVKAPGYQLMLMVLLMGVGLLLNWVSYQWLRAAGHDRRGLRAIG